MTIVPPPAAASSGMPNLASRKAPVRLTASTRSHSSSVISGTVLATPMPALAQSRSSRPNVATARRTAPDTSSALAASPATNSARPPRALIAAATPFPWAASTSTRIRAAPWAAKSSAPAAPMPLAAPVISPTRRMNLYYFYMNYKNLNGNSDVVWTIGAKFALLKTNSPDALRYGVRNQAIAARIFESGGWHFSYLMDEATIIAKIKSFSHQEYNRGRFLRKINIEQLVSASDDLFGRSGFRWSIVEEADLPRYVIEHKTDFQRFFVTAQPKRSKALRTSPAQRLLPRQLGQSLRTYMAAVVKGFRA